jgi:cell division protein FtsL
MSAKETLLDEVEPLIAKRKKLGFGYFAGVILTMSFVMVLAFPKIYLTEEIYYKSREIAKLKVEYETLKEENKRIRASVESIKFKNQILDTLF